MSQRRSSIIFGLWPHSPERRLGVICARNPELPLGAIRAAIERSSGAARHPEDSQEYEHSAHDRESRPAVSAAQRAVAGQPADDEYDPDNDVDDSAHGGGSYRAGGGASKLIFIF